MAATTLDESTMANDGASSPPHSRKGAPHNASEGARIEPVVINAAVVARFQTVLSALAFGSALIIGCTLHYKKIVRNGVAGWPEEWMPSVSATIGDWYPERNIFQILIALTAPPRFAILFLSYYLHRSVYLILLGIIRTVACGGWVFITSNDDGNVHDIMMIGYMLLNIPWMAGNVILARTKGVKRKRTWIATAFFTTLIPLVYFYIQHKVHRVPGAYTRYAIFEWSLIFFDVYFDYVAEWELKDARTFITLGPLLPEPVYAQNKDTVMFGDKIEQTQQVNDISKEVKEEADKAPADASKATLGLAPVHDTLRKDISQSKKELFRKPLSFASDVYLSYIFWSTFTSLIPTLFYFSVWELGLAGNELALLTLLSPSFLAWPPFFLPSPVPTLSAIMASKKGRVLGHSLSFATLVAWLSNSPFTRLLVVGGSCVVLTLTEVVSWAGLVGADGGEEYRSAVTSLGFVVSALSKHANHGNNPVWPFIDPKNGGYNKTGLILALLALLDYASRSSSLDSDSDAPIKLSSSELKVIKIPSFLYIFLTASLPLGSLIFSIHNLISDPSTLVAVSWTGWENGTPRGPLPHVHGALTMIVMCVGVALGIWGLQAEITSAEIEGDTKRKNPLLGVGWFLVGCAGAYGMYKERNWIGYISGLTLGFFLVSVLPAFMVKTAALVKSGVHDNLDGGLADTSAGEVAKTYGGAMLVYILFNLASIFTVAYAFVPGGWVFRERTDMVLTAQMAALAFAFRWPGIPSSSMFTKTSNGISNLARRYTYTTLAVISVLSVLTTLYRLPLVPPRPYRPGPRILRAGIWTVHFGIDNEGHDSQRGMRNLIRDMELDIVGLLETDLHRTAFGHRDLTRIVVEELGFNVDIGPGPNSHTWGAVLLSKFPIIKTTHHLLPSPGGELAPAIEAVLDVYGTEVLVIVAHNGQEEDPLDRELQSTELAKIMAASTRPVIFLGYVVTQPHASRPNPYEIMVTDGNVHDIDQDDADRWCEYIFYRGLYRTSYARLSRGIITDTELQIGQFVMPRHGTNVTDDSHDARYLRSGKEALPVEHWFPMEYYGNEESGGVNGHYYHVFWTPLYYQIPEGALV